MSNTVFASREKSIRTTWYYATNAGEKSTKLTHLAQLIGLPEFFFAI